MQHFSHTPTLSTVPVAHWPSSIMMTSFIVHITSPSPSPSSVALLLTPALIGADSLQANHMIVTQGSSEIKISL